MNDKNQTKNCHYVQQAYLKNFASNEKKTHIWEFDRHTNKISDAPKKIKEVAKKDYFYPQWLEEWFSQNIENDGIQIIKKLTYHKVISKLEDEEKRILLEWIFIQLVRTIGFQNLNTFFKKSEDKNIPAIPSQLIQDFIHNNYDLRKISKVESQFKSILWNFMFNKVYFSDFILANHRCSIIENRTDYDYLTSDNPVTYFCFNTVKIPMEFDFEWHGNNEIFDPKFIKLL